MAQTSDPRSVRSPDPRYSLAVLDAEQRQLCDALLQLEPAQLELPSNLPGWRVLDLAVHITRVCDSILKAVERARVGDQTPAFGAAARPREEAIRAMPAAGWVDLQRSSYQRLTDIVAGLSDAELDRCTFPHPQGPRSIRWFCTQLLAEVGFHRWDLAWSLGARAPLDDGLAAYLLPFLLDPAEPLFGIVRTQGEQASFTVSSDGQSWVLHAGPSGTTVERQPDGPEPRIAAAPGWLALAVYGRVRVDLPAFDVSGPPETADRFAAIFGPKPEAQPVEVIRDEQQVLAYVIRVRSRPTQTAFYTPDDASLQVGHIVYRAGEAIARHLHLPIERHLRGTGEVLIVQHGRCEFDVFADNRRLIRTLTLEAGDIAVSLAGGHGFRLLEDTVLLEVKQGPYPGVEAVKTRF